MQDIKCPCTGRMTRTAVCHGTCSKYKLYAICQKIRNKKINRHLAEMDRTDKPKPILRKMKSNKTLNK